MRFLIPLLGKTKEPYLAAGICDYAARLGRFGVVDLPVLKERHGHKDPDAVVKLNDAGLLLEQASVAGLRIALDPTGKTPDSEELAALLTHPGRVYDVSSPDLPTVK